MNMPHDDIGCETCCCDGQWQPHHICHGDFGIDMVFQYLSALDINTLPLDLWLKTGLAWGKTWILWWVWLLHSDIQHWKDWMVYLQPSLHRSALNTEGKNSHKGYVYEVAAVTLLMKWKWVFLRCRYSFLKFWIYLAFSVFINSLHGFIYCLCWFTTFL
jgi:hypothetical protein